MRQINMLMTILFGASVILTACSNSNVQEKTVEEEQQAVEEAEPIKIENPVFQVIVENLGLNDDQFKIIEKNGKEVLTAQFDDVNLVITTKDEELYEADIVTSVTDTTHPVAQSIGMYVYNFAYVDSLFNEAKEFGLDWQYSSHGMYSTEIDFQPDFIEYEIALLPAYK